MEKIHYICSYSLHDSKRRILTQPSGVAKINYVKSALKRAGYSVNILSLAEGDFNPPFFFYPSLYLRIDEKEVVQFISTFCRVNFFCKILSRLWMYFQLLKYLSFNVGKGEYILIYHSLAYILPIKIFRFFSHKRIYFEVEELFHAAYADGMAYLEKEKKYLQNASGYILVNDLIASLSGFNDKKKVVCYGTYDRVKLTKSSFNDRKIHIVYAGVIDDGDVMMAVDMCRFLSDRYRMHVLGYGLDKYLQKLQAYISEVNGLLGTLVVSYDGCLSGYEYFSFLSKCDIGICPRLLDDNLSNYTFPSKVLAYISNGLVPIVSPLSCIKASQISSYVVFVREVTSEAFAEAVKSIDVTNSYDNSCLDKLDRQFVSDLRSLFVNEK